MPFHSDQTREWGSDKRTDMVTLLNSQAGQATPRGSKMLKFMMMCGHRIWKGPCWEIELTRERKPAPLLPASVLLAWFLF